MSRLERARAIFKGEPHEGVPEYQARMGGYLCSALTLIDQVEADILDNVRRKPDDPTTAAALASIDAAKKALEPLINILCPITGGGIDG